MHNFEVLNTNTKNMHKLPCLLLSLLLALCSVTPALADETIIIRMAKDQTNGEVIHRAPAQIPMTCLYSVETSSLTVIYLANLGSISIDIENHTTGEVSHLVGNAVAGVHNIPISGTSGIWSICFTLSDDTRYYGEFEIQSYQQ